jgi:hypothetical protein
MTMSHSRRESAEQVLEDLCTAWDAVSRSKRWARFKEQIGLVGYIRTLEVTHSMANGWHPHYHVVLLTDRPIGLDPDDPIELLDATEELTELWAVQVAKRGRSVHRGIGVDLVPVREASGLGAYVSKIALESTRGDLKRGRGGSRSPWELALDGAEGDRQAVELWREYVTAITHRRWISTSRGLWARFGLAVKTDQEIAEETPDEIAPTALLDREVYESIRNSERHVVTELRQLVEAGADVVLIASVVSRRLSRTVQVQYQPDDEGVASLVFTGPACPRPPAARCRRK